MNFGCLVGLVAAVGLLAQVPEREDSAMTEQAGPAETLENGFYALRVESGAIVSLRLDASGQGRYGEELVADARRITGIAAARPEGRRLTLETTAEGFSWPLPFMREGFYDADRHLNYPDPESAEGAVPLVLPVRKFVSSAGQVLFIEYFKRLPEGNHGVWLNLAQGARFGIFGDEGTGGHVAVHVPDQDAVRWEVGDDFLRLHTGEGAGTVELDLFADAAELEESLDVALPAMTFEPERTVKYDFADKAAPASPLATDLLRMAGYWHPTIQSNGEWMLEAVRTHWFDSAPSAYHANLRESLFRNLSLVGYDRYEHFGMLFNWGQYPDYGAGGLLNVPENNGAYDMRFLHVNAMYVIAVAEYVMATGDRALLRARPARWIETDGDESQPLCGGDAPTFDYVLAAGDRRIDGKMPEKTFYLGQTFTATKPFQTVTLRLGSPVTNGADVYEDKPMTEAVIEVYEADSGRMRARGTVTVKVREHDQKVSVKLDAPAEPGRYEVRLSDPRSGERYFGPVVAWWTDPEADYDGGEATWGPTPGAVYDRLKTLFNYLYEYTGVKDNNLSYYPDDPELNVPDLKSGRPGVTMQNSYHECLGGGYDAFMGLWWPPACRAMAQLAAIQGDEEWQERCESLYEAAKEAYNDQYWHTVNENGREFQRYYGCKDWDGNIHDYGFTYYNVEAAQFGIPRREQAWEIFRWLDRGFWKVEPDAPWQEDIYAPWQISPPFNTIEIGDWVGITGKLPYFEVLTNGGTRLIYEARALAARRAYLSIDNAHERNEQVLARFASPDRLTGGRTFDDPGGRGRWHFGPPYVDRADIEGFREIFAGNGSLGSAQIALYLGASFEPEGLRLTPEVPSTLETVRLSDIGFRGHIFDFEMRALREDRTARMIEASDGKTWTFQAEQPFNKVGLRIRTNGEDVPFQKGARVTLVLEEAGDGGEGRVIARDQLSHVRNGQQVWIRTREPLNPDRTYRLRLEELEGFGAAVGPETADAPALAFERTALTVRRNSSVAGDVPTLKLADGTERPLGDGAAEVILSPGEGALLRAPWKDPA